MSKIFIRKLLNDNFKLEPKIKKRKRNRYVNFRVTSEEYEMLNDKVKMSGLLKQDYIIQAVLKHRVVTIGNIKSFTVIKERLKSINDKLNDLECNAVIDERDIESLKTIVKMINGLE